MVKPYHSSLAKAGKLQESRIDTDEATSGKQDYEYYYVDCNAWFNKFGYDYFFLLTKIYIDGTEHNIMIKYIINY